MPPRPNPVTPLPGRETPFWAQPHDRWKKKDACDHTWEILGTKNRRMKGWGRLGRTGGKQMGAIFKKSQFSEEFQINLYRLPTQTYRPDCTKTQPPQGEESAKMTQQQRYG